MIMLRSRLAFVSPSSMQLQGAQCSMFSLQRLPKLIHNSPGCVGGYRYREWQFRVNIKLLWMLVLFWSSCIVCQGKYLHLMHIASICTACSISDSRYRSYMSKAIGRLYSCRCMHNHCTMSSYSVLTVTSLRSF